MKAFESYWLGRIAAVRPWLLLKAVLLLFAFDTWADHLGPAWRYGAAGFNVAHFGVLDLLPIASSATYVGAIVGVGIAAFLCAAVPRPQRAIVVGVAVVYGWSWSHSMHDSYQHHYLLSWIFVAFCFFPLLSAVDTWGVPESAQRVGGAGPEAAKTKRKKIKRKGAAREAVAEAPPAAAATTKTTGALPVVSSFAYALVMVTCGVVYSYTAISKTEPDWLSGHALRDITADGRSVPAFIDFAARLGFEGDDLWWWMGHGVVLLQIGIALGYFTAPLRDQPAPRPARIALEVIAWIALALSLQFHLGAEYMGLEIGWFSWYMILVALTAFLPARWLDTAMRVLSTPGRELSSTSEPSTVSVGVIGFAAAVSLGAGGFLADLPGALPACVLAGTAILLWGVVAGGMRKPLRDARAASIAGIVAGLGIVVAMQGSEERFDYWRFGGGDFRRRGETALALDAYEHALRHAPTEIQIRTDAEGRPLEEVSQHDRIEERVRQLREQLERERSH